MSAMVPTRMQLTNDAKQQKTYKCLKNLLKKRTHSQSH